MAKLMAWWEEDFSGDNPAVVSNNFWELVGYTKKEVGCNRQDWLGKMNEEDQERMKEVIKNEIWEIDFRLPQKDGSSIWLRETGRWSHIENGRPKKISAVVKNVTLERKSLERMENREKQNAAIAKEIMELCPVAMALFLIKDTGAKLLDINDAGIKLWKFVSYQDAAENVIKVVTESIPPVQPNGIKSIPFSERMAAVMKDGNLEFRTFLNIKGVGTNIKIHMRKIELPEKTFVIVYMLPE